MSNRKQKTAIALTGAVALASGAYALGTQAGDGTAAADDPARPAVPAIRAHLHGARPGLDNLADRLGVEESELREALEDVRPQLPRPDRGNFAESLAKELGIDESEVEAALERLRDKAEQEFEQSRDDFAQRLADRLNVDVDEVKDALENGPFGLFHLAPPRAP
jgi:hypothetical protein